MQLTQDHYNSLLDDLKGIITQTRIETLQAAATGLTKGYWLLQEGGHGHAGQVQGLFQSGQAGKGYRKEICACTDSRGWLAVGLQRESV